MRSRERAHAWKSAEKRPRSQRLLRVTFENVQGLGDGTIDIDPFLSTIVGGNGAGKTSVLRIIWAAIGGNLDELGDWKKRLANARTTAEVLVAGRQKMTSISFDANGDAVDSPGLLLTARYLDLSRVARQAQHLLGDDAQRESLLESLSPKDLDRDEIGRAARVVRRDYRQASVFEVDIDDDERPLPHFLVAEAFDGSPVYGTHAMGLGELAIFLCRWNLSKLQKDELVLLDEPETSIAEASQIQLLDEFAGVAADTGACFVVSTHSSRIVNACPISGLRLVIRDSTGADIQSPVSRRDAMNLLSMDSLTQVVCYVEDGFAAAIARDIIRLTDDSLLDGLEFVVLEGKDEVERGVRTQPLPRAINGIGLLDGDARNHERTGGTFFLPSTDTPEQFTRKILEENTNGVAAHLGCTLHQVRIAMRSAEGVDDHAWLAHVAKSLGIGWQIMLSAVIMVWCQREDSVGVREQFITDMQSALTEVAKSKGHG